MSGSLGPLGSLFSTDGFMPHGHCYLWNPALIWLHVLSDGLTALSYTSIPFTLWYFSRKRKDLPFNWMFLSFGTFIVACGATHYLEIVTLWTPVYWLSGAVKAITAIASVPTAILLVKLVPQALALPSPGELRAANERLEKTTRELRLTQARLEKAVEERTSEWRQARDSLQLEIGERLHAEEALKRSQDQLRHAAKMEAVGRLAGGVAHDFNNLLSVVLSYSGMLLEQLPPDHEMRDELRLIEEASTRAASLTQQLLAFSRQQVLQPRAVELNAVVARLKKMLTRLIGENIELVTDLDAALGYVHVDPGQIEQVIVNLVVNARDALPRGGRVTVRTRTAPRDEDGTEHAVITIADDGVGMDAATLERIYEPFFTTKDLGKGTGLGLATVFGIVQQSGGHIDVESAPGAGTKFTIRFPVHVPEDDDRESGDRENMELVGRETILVVEDEAIVRDLVVEILRRQGYSVISAASGAEALTLCDNPQLQLDLLVTDVVMPVMDGRELAERVVATRPSLRVLLMSGYPNDVLDPKGEGLDGRLQFLAKPIRPRALGERVRAVLASGTESRGQAMATR